MLVRELLELVLSRRSNTCLRSNVYKEIIRIIEYNLSLFVLIEKEVCKKNAILKVFIQISFTSRLVIVV